MGYSPWGCKELDTTERLSTHASTVIMSYRMGENHILVLRELE